VANSDDRAGPQVAAVLDGLAARHASGALEIDGRPSGTIYLDRGRITFARASWSPDLGTRLCNLLRPPAELLDLLRTADHPDGDVGEVLVGRGYVTREALRATLESVVMDAIMVLTVPLSDEAFVADIRLDSPRAHWAGSLCKVGVEAARKRATATAARMTRHGVPHTACLELRELDRGCAVLTRGQWAVASKINGSLTTWDLAWHCGLPLSDTFEAVGALAGAGLCGPSAAPDTAPDRGSRPIMPRRRQAAQVRRPPAEGAAADDQRAGGQRPDAQRPEETRFSPMPLESLRRVLDGLRRLS
jgi:hypothetical protein